MTLFEKESLSGQSAGDELAGTTLRTFKPHLKIAEELPGPAAAGP